MNAYLEIQDRITLVITMCTLYPKHGRTRLQLHFMWSAIKPHNIPIPASTFWYLDCQAEDQASTTSFL